LVWEHDKPYLASWLINAPAEMLPIFDYVAYAQVKKMFPQFDKIHPEIHVRISDLNMDHKIRDLRYELSATEKVLSS